MYALVLGGGVHAVLGAMPAAARRIDTGQWVTPPDGVWTDEQAALCGYLPVVDVARPADTPTDTYVRSVELVAGQPTVVWTARPWTADELAAQQADANRTTIRQAAEAALITNRATLDTLATLLAGSNPTTVAALGNWVRGLMQSEQEATRQRQGIIRLILDRVDGLD